MKRIRVRSQKSTGLDPFLANANVIEIEDSPLGEGAFGVAYRAINFDGRRVTPQVIKIFTTSNDRARHGYETIQELQKRLAENNKSLSATGTSLLAKYPALQGVPQLSFEGDLKGSRVLGYCANDLTAAGFEDFGDILEESAKLMRFQTLPLGLKLQLALQLVTAFRFLKNELHFIHADIKPQAVFVDLNNACCALIDYDGGALARSASDTPLTYGTWQDWLAPEIVQQLGPTNRTGQIKVNLFSDVWSVNVAIHYLLFTLHPFFFLTEISERSIDSYQQRFKWPAVDVSFPYFEAQYAQIHADYSKFLTTSLPAELVDKFECTFNYGYSDPNRRASYSQWEMLLQALDHPAIYSFKADRTLVNDSRPVRLSWNVTGAAHIEIKGLANVTGKGWLDVNVTCDAVFELVLTSFSGGQISKTIHISVSKVPPVIHSFHSSSTLLNSSNLVQLSWRISGSHRIQIDNGVGDVTGRVTARVNPRKETTYTLIATSLFGITARASVHVQVSNTPPTIGYFSADRTFLTNKAPVTLSWHVSDDAHEVSINEVGTVSKQGSVVVYPRRDITYILTATSYFAYSTSRDLQIMVSKVSPVISLFEVSPSVVWDGMEAAVCWKVENAEEVFLEPKVGRIAAEGQTHIRALSSRRITLRAVSYFGASTSRSASVTILKRTTLTSKRTELTRKRTILWT